MPDGGARRSGIALTENQRIAWLRLIRSDNVGPATFRQLINHCGSAENALAMLPELSRRGGATRSLRITSIEEAEREFEAARRHDASFVGIGEPDYPPALRHIDGAPPLVAIKGNFESATRPSIGIVGSRNASVVGAKFAAMIARRCGQNGYVITSGLARGIDTAAHRASIETGTIAVLAGGLDRPYPPENLALLDEITNGAGIAISEMPFGWEPRARDFPRRNRLIAGIARRRGGRGGRKIRFADYRPDGRRFRPDRLCGPGFSARPALSRNECVAQAGSSRNHGTGGCARSTCAFISARSFCTARGRGTGQSGREHAAAE